MSAIIHQDWRKKTLKELYIQWQAFLLESWHHTAHIKGCWAGKGTSYESLHPFLSRAGRATAIPIQPVNLFERVKMRDGERVSILDDLLKN